MIIAIVLITTAVLVSLCFQSKEDTYTGWIDKEDETHFTDDPDVFEYFND